MAENLATLQNSKFEAVFALANGFRDAHPEWITEIVNALGEITVIVPREFIVDICRALKMEHQFDMLMDLNGADLGAEEEPRFEILYHLFSTKTYYRLRLKVLVSDEDPHVQSVTSVWRTANWHERETYDMFGVIFDNHPDLRRILLPSDFDGHALRKDYPLRGFEPYSLS